MDKTTGYPKDKNRVPDNLSKNPRFGTIQLVKIKNHIHMPDALNSGCKLMEVESTSPTNSNRADVAHQNKNYLEYPRENLAGAQYRINATDMPLKNKKSNNMIIYLST